MLSTNYQDYGYDDWNGSFFIYGCAGFVTDGDWMHSDHSTPWERSRRIFWEIEPEPQYKLALEAIRALDHCARSRAAMIILGSHRAVSLCVEGYVQPVHFDHAVQVTSLEPFVDYIDIPNVDIDSELMTMRVINDADVHKLVVADDTGAVLLNR